MSLLYETLTKRYKVFEKGLSKLAYWRIIICMTMSPMRDADNKQDKIHSQYGFWRAKFCKIQWHNNGKFKAIQLLNQSLICA